MVFLRLEEVYWFYTGFYNPKYLDCIGALLLRLEEEYWRILLESLQVCDWQKLEIIIMVWTAVPPPIPTPVHRSSRKDEAPQPKAPTVAPPPLSH